MLQINLEFINCFCIQYLDYLDSFTPFLKIANSVNPINTNLLLEGSSTTTNISIAKLYSFNSLRFQINSTMEVEYCCCCFYYYYTFTKIIIELIVIKTIIVNYLCYYYCCFCYYYYYIKNYYYSHNYSFKLQQFYRLESIQYHCFTRKYFY